MMAVVCIHRKQMFMFTRLPFHFQSLQGATTSKKQNKLCGLSPQANYQGNSSSSLENWHPLSAEVGTNFADKRRSVDRSNRNVSNSILGSLWESVLVFIYVRQSLFWKHSLHTIIRISAKVDFVFEKIVASRRPSRLFLLSTKPILSYEYAGILSPKCSFYLVPFFSLFLSIPLFVELCAISHDPSWPLLSSTSSI
jgi:hypothetical protein